MKILITGHKGFIGKYIHKAFPDAIGYDIKEVSEDNILNTAHLLSVLKKNEIDTIIHLAAYVSVAESEKNPQLYICNNIEGTMSVVKAAIGAGVKKIIYASSSASAHPSSSIYALTKYVPELILDCYSDQIETASLRFYNIYGRGSNPVYGRAIDEFIRGIKKNNQVTIYGSGRQTRDFIHVKDVVRAIKLAIENKIVLGGPIDIGTGESISINKLANTIGELMDKQPKIVYAPPRKEIRYSRADLMRAKKLLSFEPQISLREGLRELI